MKTKKLFTMILMGAFALGFIALSLTSCDMLNETDDVASLPTPANVRVDDAGKTAFTLKWDAVAGADSYTVDIDGELKQVSGSTTSYDLKALTADPKVYPIRVRAVAYNGDTAHSDSAYSAAIYVEPAEYVFTYEDELAPSPSVQLSRSIARAATGGKKITGLTNYGKGLDSIVIPPKIGSIDVVTIGDDAFKDNAQISTISLPQTIITIGAGAFSGTNIASIVIPESVLTIGDGAFSNIIVLVVVVFVSPEPPVLGDNVFDGSDAIEKIIVPEGKGDDYTDMIEDKAPGIADKVDDKPQTPSEEPGQPGDYTITINKVNGGQVWTDPEGSANEGETVEVYVAIEMGYTLETLSIKRANGNTIQYETITDSKGGFTYYTFTMPPSNVVISATFSGSSPFDEGDYTITVNQTDDRGELWTSPHESANEGETVRIYVTPKRDFSVDRDYALNTLTITGANGNTIPYEVVTQNQSDPNYNVYNHTIIVCYTFTMPNSDVAISATFKDDDTWPIFWDTGNNDHAIITIVTPDPFYGRAAAGELITFTLTVFEGHRLDSIVLQSYMVNPIPNLDPPASPDVTTYSFIMPDGEIYIFAGILFTHNEIKVHSVNGTIATDQSERVLEGTTVRFTVTPKPGSTLGVIWVRDDYGNTINYETHSDGSGTYYTFTMPAWLVWIEEASI